MTRKPLLGLHQRAELARPFHAVALRQRHVLGDALLRLGHGRAEIALAHAVFQRNEALAVLAVDIGRAGLELARRRGRPARYRRSATSDRCSASATGIERMASTLSRYSRRQPHGEREIHLALVDPGHLLAADRRLHHGVDVADREAVARGLGAVDPDHEIGLAQQIEAAGIGDARHLGESRPCTAFDSRSSSARSRPKILTEFSPFTPDTASSILSWMYCEKLKSMPTNSRLSCSLICLTSCSLVRPFGHSSSGFSGTKNSATNEPSGSVRVVAAALLGDDRLHRRDSS